MHVWNMLMKAHLNDCLRMHVRTNAGLWIYDHLNVVLWCNAFLSLIFDEFISSFCIQFSHHNHVWKHLFWPSNSAILTAAPWLILSSATIWKAISAIYDLMMSMPKKNKVQRSEQWGDLKCDQSFPRRRYWSHKLWWQLQPIPSQSPLSHFNSLSV